MGKNSAIEWTDNTFNPWWGCVKVSPGCTNCYAESFSGRWGFDVWGPTAGRRLFSARHWNEPVKWNRQARKAGVQTRVFCGSMCDVFEVHPDPEWNAVLDGERAKLWDLIDETPHLIWMLLTKRPENIERLLPERWQPYTDGRLPRNCWLGISAENQDQLERRWPVLESVAHYQYPAVLFLSLEPLLGPIDLEICLTEIDIGDEEHSWWTRPVDWVIAGGESGHNARPMRPDWARSIRDQCQETGTPYFFKQWGAWVPVASLRPGDQILATGDHKAVFMRRIGKKVAGRLLDGQAWSQMPEVGR